LKRAEWPASWPVESVTAKPAEVILSAKRKAASRPVLHFSAGT
jgi:hypothetical protein